MEQFSYFSFNNQTSLSHNLYIAKKDNYVCPARDVQYIDIPGRDGALIIDNGRYKNVDVKYEMSILNTTQNSFGDLARSINTWLTSGAGIYRVLWDTYDSGYYRLANFSKNFNIEQNLRDYGTFNITFNCKPHKYSFAGQNSFVAVNNSTFYNPELYDSKPLLIINISGNGEITINNTTFAIDSVYGKIYIDFEMMCAYQDDNLLNDHIYDLDMSTFAFKPGNNTIGWEGHITRVEIVPRWRCL